MKHCIVCHSMVFILIEPWLGAAMTPYRRMVDYADYGLDVKNMSRGLRVATDGSPLPNPRFLSNSVTHREGKDSTSTHMSIHVMQMGQFLDHDVAHPPNTQSQCCGSVETKNEECIPIDITTDDPYFSDKNVDCMSMARSLSSPDLDCALDIERQQVIL